MSSKRQFEGSAVDYGHPDDIHGIERAVLCKNIFRERDDSDKRVGDDENIIDRVEEREELKTTTEAIEKGATIRSGRHQTGPKGVLNAYNDAMHGKSYLGKKDLIVEESNVKNASVVNDSRPRNSSDSEDEDEDLEFLKKFRDARLRELAAIERIKKTHPVYGTVKDIVKAEEFLDIVDDASPASLIVVHIFESFVPGCAALNRYMNALAKKYTRTLFVRLRGSLTSSTFDHIACPAISAYKGGKLVKSCVRITDDIGERPTLGEFCEFLTEALPDMGLEAPSESFIGE